MSGPSWLIDSKRIATKIKNASGMLDPSRLKWISNPTKACPRCNHIIDNGDVVQEWPGLPKGVKFDPSDPELISHLMAKVGIGDEKPHPFINEFIPTVDEEDGICYTHPQKLPGVKKDGSISHFFHRTFKAYNTGTRKRRKINTDDFGDVRWHKTGKTKPVLVDRRHLGCKKIMVLYMGRMKGEKPKKTNWVMHQYHLGTGEDEMDGEYVVSKIFYQKQAKPSDTNEQNLQMEKEVVGTELDPSPEQDTNEQGHVNTHMQTYEQDLCMEMQAAAVESAPSPAAISTSPEKEIDELDQIDRHMQTSGQSGVHNAEENQMHHEGEYLDDEGEHPVAETKWWESESQYHLLDSQQLAEQIAICEEFLQSQSSCPGEETKKNTSKLSDYAHLSPEVLKRDLEECQKLVSVDHANTEVDYQDFRLSQLEFGSQDSFLAWPESKVAED